MATGAKLYITPQEYLSLERQSEHKSEYIDGEIHAMTGASRAHNLITVNVAREISQQLKGKNCEAYSGEMRIRIPDADRYVYPGTVVVCGEPIFEDDFVDTLINPTLIIEVLSASSESYDRGKKFGDYRTIDSFLEYVLVAQDEYRVEQYTGHSDGRWLLSEARSIDDNVQLSSIACTLSLREIYDKVRLGGIA
jgi:Uma2 family endonuclease